MSDNKTILVTGGAGYIGSHTVVELATAGYIPIIVDDYSNSSPKVLDRLEEIIGKRPTAYELDVCDTAKLGQIIKDHAVSAIIHFAAYKAVGESVEQPLKYYKNNLNSTLSVATAALQHNVGHVVFSSSCTVYGDPQKVPITEDAAVHAVNPYGQTKVMSEQILQDVSAASNKTLGITLLRYFNPIGAHASGLIGEDPNGIPNNLVPYVAQVAVGRQKEVRVFGNDYPTADGTGIRDYIHVVDLAKGHIAALNHEPQGTTAIYNLGTGHGQSVLEVIRAFELASGKKIPYEIVERRPGDIAEAYADTTKAKRELQWSAQYDLADMCRDSWNWQSKNPNGYKD